MLVRPSELPKHADLEIDPALQKISDWKLENSEPRKKAHQSIAFVDERIGAFFNRMRRVIPKIERAKSGS